MEAQAGGSWNGMLGSLRLQQAVSAETRGHVRQPCMLLKEESLEGSFMLRICTFS